MFSGCSYGPAGLSGWRPLQKHPRFLHLLLPHRIHNGSKWTKLCRWGYSLCVWLQRAPFGGFVSDGGNNVSASSFSSTDIDECVLEQQCRPELGNVCVNTPGSFVCQCQPGFRAEAPACIGEPGFHLHHCSPHGLWILSIHKVLHASAVLHPCSVPLLSGPVCPHFTVCQGMRSWLYQQPAVVFLLLAAWLWEFPVSFYKHHSVCPFLVPQMWTNVWRVLQCVAMVRVCVRTHWGAISVFVRQVTKETAHTVKVVH